ncbi:MAG: GMC family oxidoreductase N-terminal domain-containing protein [Devosia sp.]
MDRFDVIVVGGGSGGGVAAARLTENPDCRVLLLEAGPDFPREEVIPPLFTVSGEHSWKTAAIPELDWDFFNADRSGTLNGRELWLPRGKLMGGTSMVNATIAARGAPFDFDRWAAMGNTGWAWDDVLPYFIKIETDLDFGDQPIHGKSGPIVIQRYKPESWAPINRVMYESCVELGIREAPDLNALDAHAGVVGVMPHNRYKEVRLGTLVTYIRAARKRPNLTIAARSVVDRVLLRGRSAEGVTYVDARGETQTAYADQVILSAGVYSSPAILQRSGVGPSDWLKPLGIDVVADLPVGKNLLDHPGFGMIFKGKGLGITTGRSFVADVRGPAGPTGEPAWQTHPFPVDEEEGMAGFWTYLTHALAQGEVIIKSRNPLEAPLIDHRYNTVAQDRQNFDDARTFCKEMLASATFRRHNAEWVDDINQPIAEALAQRMGAAHHQCGTAKMGPATDKTAVVDTNLRVHGFDNLRVADTSVYPDNVQHNTNLTAYVVGERVAEFVAGSLGL